MSLVQTNYVQMLTPNTYKYFLLFAGLLMHPLLHQKTLQFPPQYRPKSLEERIRRGHARQLSSQIDSLASSKNSAMTNTSVRGLRIEWCDSVWCGVAWHRVVWRGVVWHSVMWCDVMWCDTVWRNVVWCMAWHKMVWCSVGWCVVRYLLKCSVM